jgi:hypothetical protein
MNERAPMGDDEPAEDVSPATKRLRAAARGKRAVVFPAMGLLLVLLIVFAAWRAATPTASVPNAQQELDAALPAGTSLVVLRTYLDAHGYSYSEPYALDASAASQVTELAGVPEGTNVILAHAGGNTRWWFDLFTGEVEAYFVLDADDRVERVIVTKSLAGF